MLQKIEMRFLALLELVGEEMVPESQQAVCRYEGHENCWRNANRTVQLQEILYKLRTTLERSWSDENENASNRIDVQFPDVANPFGPLQ